MRPLSFQLLRELSHERFTSGTKLAAQFGVSRTLVSEALREAADAGVGIFSLTRRGYRLAAPFELLDLTHIRKTLGARAARVDIDIVESIASTNSELMVRAGAGAPSGTCLAAEMQTAGRGRRGRAWQSSLGGALTFSLLWRFDKGAPQLGGLSLIVGLAVLRALRKLGAGRDRDDVQLKWPNDIVSGGRKLGGILIETQGDMLGPTAAVIGIGLNVQLSETLKESIDQPACDVASLMVTPVSRNTLFATVLAELIAMLDQFQASGFTAFKAEWLTAHALQGKHVNVLAGDGKITHAEVIGVHDDGSLIVLQHGREMALSSGEVSLRPHRP